MSVTAPVYTESGCRQNETISGTSMATPIFAGEVAVIFEAESSQVNKTSALRDRLEGGVEPMKVAGETEDGHGYLNVTRVVNENNSSQTQADAKDATANARDKANKSFGGNRVVQFIANRSRPLPIPFGAAALAAAA